MLTDRNEISIIGEWMRNHQSEGCHGDPLVDGTRKSGSKMTGKFRNFLRVRSVCGDTAIIFPPISLCLSEIDLDLRSTTGFQLSDRFAHMVRDISLCFTF
jgi:hypothetical protein